MINLTTFKPQLVGTGNIDYFLFNNDVVALEPKLDGVRCLIHKQGKSIALYSRTGKDWTARFPDIISSLSSCLLADNLIVDGELCVVEGPKFTTASTALRKTLTPSQQRTFFAFDILQVDEHSLLDLPLLQRKNHLNILTRDSPSFHLIPHHCVNNKEDVLSFYRRCIPRYEGVVLKNLGKYTPSSRFGWLKLKPVTTLDMTVISKELTKDGKLTLYTLQGEGILLRKVISSIHAPVGAVVEVCYEKSPVARPKFPKILRVRDDK